MTKYSCIEQQEFSNGEYKLVPIRLEDRYEIMRWRNEQLYHLRQKEPLTMQQQDDYFENVVSKLFYQKEPNQILFSFLKNDVLIGYGGLVHINWLDKNAEISFILNTELEMDYFHEFWTQYLELIEQVAFMELLLHKLFVYAFDLRAYLYDVLVKSKYFLDAKLKEHCLFNGEFIDVVIYSKMV